MLPALSAKPAAPYVPQIRLYQRWLASERGLVFADYPALHHWSVTQLEAFWQSIWDYFEVQSPTPHTSVLTRAQMPGAQWFTGAQVNYAAQVFRHTSAAHAAGMAAIVSHNEASLANAMSVRSAGPPQASTAPAGLEPAASNLPAQVWTGDRNEAFGERRPARCSALHEVSSVGAHMSWPELQRRVASLALHLQAQGVQPGDRVAAYLPNTPEAAIAFLAVASIGAIWSICAPDMGTAAVLDRFKQIEPTALIACASVTYGGRTHARIGVVTELLQGLPSVRHVVLQGASDDECIAITSIAACAQFDWATRRNDAETARFQPLWVPFDHPLWIVYSSGTTGLPKPIVHGHGGVVVVALANKVLHNDVGCSYAANSFGERYHWYSSTGWVMWNAQVSGLLNGTTCVIFDGNPGGTKENPDWTTLWRFAAQTGVTFFGAGAAFFANCMKAGVDLSACGDLSKIRALGSTGSPLSIEAQQWGTDQFAALGTPERSDGPPLASSALSGGSESHAVGGRGGTAIWFCNISGGTDFAGAFIGGNRELPQVAGEMQCRLLGCAVEAWDESGTPVIGEVGELVCSQPIPSMPLYLWGDTNNARYLSSYFDMYPNVWRHGDWLKVTATGSCIIYGRSDATINRHGLRMGTSELYSAVEALPEVLDSMVVDLEYLGRESYMPLFVVLRPGLELSDELKTKLNDAIKLALSPRFVPNEIFAVPDIPRTLSGKKQELPIKKLLLGQPLEKVVNKEAMANPACLQWYVDFAAARALKSG